MHKGHQSMGFPRRPFTSIKVRFQPADALGRGGRSAPNR
jgi:hypothetical protein